MAGSDSGGSGHDRARVPLRPSERRGAAGHPARDSARPARRLAIPGPRRQSTGNPRHGAAARRRTSATRPHGARSARSRHALGGHHASDHGHVELRVQQRAGGGAHEGTAMNRFIVAEDLENVLAQKVRAPTLVAWNRLEGRPRRPDFTRALKAEVRDPLWLLTRQWQMGEFVGEDAGSPIGAKLAWRSDPVLELRGPAGGTRTADANEPLEAVVEARPVPLVRAGLVHHVDLRLSLGRRFQKLLEDGGHGTLVPAFRTAYRFVAPDPANAAEFPITAHPAAWQLLAA